MIIDPNKACNCKATVTSVPKCPDSELSECVDACNLLVSADNSVGPCGENGVIDISDKYTVPDGSTPVFQIVKHSDNITNVVITSTQITFTSDYSEGKDYRSATLEYKIITGILSDKGKVVIIFNPNGNELECVNGQEYNPCTGNCDDIVSDISLTDESSSTSGSGGLSLS